MTQRRYPIWGLLLWWGLLVLLLVRVYAPLTRLQQTLALGCVVLFTMVLALLCWFWQNRRLPALPEGLERALAALPPGLSNSAPVFLWYDPFAANQAEGAVIQDANAIWLKTYEALQMVPLAEAICRWRGRGPDGAVLAIAPGHILNLADLTHRIQTWRHALRDMQRRCGAVSTWLLVQGGSLARSDASSPRWRGFLRSGDGTPLALGNLLDSVQLQLDVSTRPGDCEALIKEDMHLQGALRWLYQVLPPLFAGHKRSLPEQRFHGALVTDAGGLRAGNLFSAWLESNQSLRPAEQTSPAMAQTLPIPLVTQAPRVIALPIVLRSVLHTVILTSLAVMLAMALSARNNRLLLHGLQADLQAWRSTETAQTETRRVALEQLKADRQQLLQYERAGVPWKLGWGLYHAGVLLPVLEREIASYRPPASAPTLISLDSLSLFSSSEARLKPDANRALVGALIELTAHPDKRVVIAGHTDNTGNPRTNQLLSEARASAVRDWFVAMSSLPASHFAIQGYGDSRPLVPNDSPENKARNRRVEITLVPDLPVH